MANKLQINTQLSFADDSKEYKEFVDKFKPKKTTDDCYTPPEIYDVILDYVVKRYGIDRDNVMRPFYPGGDYEREEYTDDCVVVDNPPFSLLSQIIDFYMTNGIRFFLFAPTLTCLSSRKHLLNTNHIVCHTSITYENGAKVNTSFITNLDTDGTVIESNPELANLINDKDRELQKEQVKTVGNYVYPDEVLTAAKVNWFSAHNTPFKVNKRDCAPIAKLDAMGKKGIFGGGLLLSKRAAAERAAATKWQLSEREKKMVEMLSKGVHQ